MKTQKELLRAGLGLSRSLSCGFNADTWLKEMHPNPAGCSHPREGW
jgi:hypothetical protein